MGYIIIINGLQILGEIQEKLTETSLSLLPTTMCMYMYVYVHVCVCTCMCMYMYVYVHVCMQAKNVSDHFPVEFQVSFTIGKCPLNFLYIQIL